MDLVIFSRRAVLKAIYRFPVNKMVRAVLEWTTSILDVFLLKLQVDPGRFQFSSYEFGQNEYFADISATRKATKKRTIWMERSRRRRLVSACTSRSAEN